MEKTSDNHYGAEYFSEEDYDVLRDMEFITHIFECKDFCPWIKIEDFQKFYDLLEKGHRLGEYQKRKLKNAYLLSLKAVEKREKMMADFRETETKNKETFEREPLSAFNPQE